MNGQNAQVYNTQFSYIYDLPVPTCSLLYSRQRDLKTHTIHNTESSLYRNNTELMIFASTWEHMGNKSLGKSDKWRNKRWGKQNKAAALPEFTVDSREPSRVIV